MTSSATQQRLLLQHPAFYYVVVPAALALIYVFPLAHWLVAGINRYFAQSLLLVISGALLLGLTGTIVWRGAKPASIATAKGTRVSAVDAALALIPLGPAAQYLILNADILPWLDFLIVGAGMAVGVLALVVFIPAIASRWGARHIVFATATALLYAFISMPVLARSFSWHEVGQFEIQLLAVVIVLVLVGFLYGKDKKVLTFVCLAVFVASCVQAFAINAQQADTRRSGQAIALHNAPAVRTPDIFLLTYDSYVENETMLGYGIDNSAQEQWLQAKGFTLYPGTYSVAASTIDTMGRVFGNFDAPRQGTAGDSAFFRQLNLAGYGTYGVFSNDYYFRGVGTQYTYSFPAPVRTSFTLLMAIAEGEFRHNAYFDKPSKSEFVAEKRSLMQTNNPHPMFLYSHTGPGHSQNSGACTPDETSRFTQRLQEANVEMRTDVETIMSANTDAIIIINGDHGPYLTKTCYDLLPNEFAPEQIDRLDIQDRYGTFLAIRWPPSDVANKSAHRSYQPMRILQDLAPTLLEYIYAGGNFNAYRLPATLLEAQRRVGGVKVQNGTIVGGADDGEPLFLSAQPTASPRADTPSNR